MNNINPKLNPFDKLRINAEQSRSIKTNIMRRVYLIWFGREVLPYLAAEALVFGVFLHLIGQYVYVANVLQYAATVLAKNMAHPLNFLAFSLDIFVRTKIIVQISVLGSLFAFFFLFKDFIKSVVQFKIAAEV